LMSGTDGLHIMTARLCALCVSVVFTSRQQRVSMLQSQIVRTFCNAYMLTFLEISSSSEKGDVIDEYVAAVGATGVVDH